MAATVTINIAQIRDKINRFSLPKAQNVGLVKAKAIFDVRKQRFLEKFDNDPITKEIEAGPTAGGSLDVNGNLFSFIGFDAGSTPIEDLYYYLNNAIHLVSRRGIYNAGDKTLIFKMSIPTEEGIKKVTDLAQYTINNNETGWGTGRSWVYSIERGIPGLNKYKFSTDPSVLGTDSRSGTGAQRKNSIHGGAAYKARSYLTKMIKILTEREQ